MSVDYPIAVDSDHAVWRAFNNEYWPALYLVDAKGKIRYHQFGEGEYERTEKVIQQLLAAAGAGGAPSGGRRVYAAPAALRLNQWALVGDWSVESGAVALNKAPGRIAYRFHARDLHLVMGPSSRGTPVRFRVSIDGKPPGAAHGVDVDADGNGTAGEQRLYQLIRQPGSVADREFEIQFLDPGVEAFAFTFG